MNSTKIIDSQNLFAKLADCEAILFDLDGTLFDLNVNWKAIKRYFKEIHLKNYNEDLDTSRFYKMFENLEQKYGKDAKKEYLRYLEEKELETVINKIPAPKWLYLKGLDLIYSQINQRSKKCFKGIISSNFHATIKTLLEDYNCLDQFEVIVGRDDVHLAKPSPEGLNNVIEKYSLNRKKTLFVGDAEVDERAATAAQISFIYVQDLENFLKN